MSREPHMLISMPTATSAAAEEAHREALARCGLSLDRVSLAGRPGGDHRPGSCTRLTAGRVREPIRSSLLIQILSSDRRWRFTRLNWAWISRDLITLVRSLALVWSNVARECSRRHEMRVRALCLTGVLLAMAVPLSAGAVANSRQAAH